MARASSATTATSGRSSRTTASPATAPTRTSARPSSGSTIRDDALAKEAIVPGKPDESELVERIFSSDPDDNDAAAGVAQEADRRPEGDLLKRWIAAGGRVPAALGLRARRSRRRSPAVDDATWVRNPIDAFILAAARSEEDRAVARGRPAHAAPPAEPRPDRPAADAARRSRPSSTTQSPDAYEKQVDRLLASPHYGERMAVALARPRAASPTRSAIHGDQNQHVFPYRDYVINAFNTQQAVRPVHRSSNSPATCCPTRRPSSSSPPASTA